MDALTALCMRESVGGVPYTMQDGQVGFIHRLDGATAPAFHAPDSMPVAAAVKCADLDTLNEVYRAFLDGLYLDCGHREHLRGRGLTDAAIDWIGCKTTPRDRRAHAARLIERFGVDVIARWPGAYYVKTDTGGYWTIGGVDGFYIPARDVDDRILALVIRCDIPERPSDIPERPKYMLLSSTCHGGPGPGSPAHVCGWNGEPGGDVWCVEGTLKSAVSASLGSLACVGIPGCGAWQKAIRPLSVMKPDRVVLAFDNDVAEKMPVLRGLLAAYDGLRALGHHVEIASWPSEFKGLDDALLAHAPIEVNGDDC